MKRLNTLRLRYVRSKGGFTLIELLIVMVILAILAGIVIISVGGVIGRGQSAAYDGAKEQVEAAVTDYVARTFGSYPYLNGTVTLATPAGNYTILDLCVLLAICNVTPPGPGILKEVPVTAYNGTPTAGCTGDECNNCAGSVFSCACQSTAHYTWLLNDMGDVYSACSGADCDATDADGFQGVYP
jgi:prepilin-type N-terminal cleavage/methylation domain-containing protein